MNTIQCNLVQNTTPFLQYLKMVTDKWWLICSVTNVLRNLGGLTVSSGSGDVVAREENIG